MAAGRLRPEDIDEARVGARMALADLPPPDLFIRTGGDHRISNFLLWQLAYTELWFTETLWPDLDAATLDRALEDFAGRERRFGLTSARSRTPGAPKPRRRPSPTTGPRHDPDPPAGRPGHGPLAIAAVLLLPTPWMAALSAAAFLIGLWEWLRLTDIEDPIARGVLLVVNLLLMVVLVWASRSESGGSLVLFQIMTVIGVGWWCTAALWLRHYDFASDHATHARVFKLAAGTLSVIPAWCALALIHAGQPHGNRWLLLALCIVWAADSGAYFAGRRFGRNKLSPGSARTRRSRA